MKQYRTGMESQLMSGGSSVIYWCHINCVWLHDKDYEYLTNKAIVTTPSGIPNRIFAVCDCHRWRLGVLCLKMALAMPSRPLSRRIPPPQPAGTLPRRRRRKKIGAPPRQPKFTEAAAAAIFLRRAAAQVILTHYDTCSSFIMTLSNSLFGS